MSELSSLLNQTAIVPTLESFTDVGLVGDRLETLSTPSTETDCRRGVSPHSYNEDIDPVECGSESLDVITSQ
jgi:hypothetical protein